MDKRKLKKFCDKFLNANTIKLIFLAIPLVFLFIGEIKDGKFSAEKYLSTDIFVTAVFLFICNFIADKLGNFIGKKCEDAVKLTVNYDSLTKKYCREKLVTYNNVKFPVQQLLLRKITDKPFNLIISQQNSNNKYELPSQVADRSELLLKSHKHSIIFNNMNVRLDDLTSEGSDVTLLYSKTTFFDSLVTNRAMDYPWENGKTIREIYEPGPFLSPLNKSRFSNHLGFNGFIETSDGKIIFVMRSGNLSIGKETLADSIGASMKVKYCYNENRQLTAEGISNAIRQEIKDELKITIDENIDMTSSIIGFYRDIVEGGKPQFLFYYKVNISFDEFKQNFAETIRRKNEKSKNLKKATIDGLRFYGFTVEQLKNSTITPGTLIINNQKFTMMPSASAAIVMLLDSFKK